jgi:hypothetical protein
MHAIKQSRKAGYFRPLIIMITLIIMIALIFMIALMSLI